MPNEYLGDPEFEFSLTSLTIEWDLTFESHPMSVPGTVGTSVKADIGLRQCVMVSSVRERGRLGARVSHVRAISRFVLVWYVFTVVNFQSLFSFRVDRCEDLGSNPI